MLLRKLFCLILLIAIVIPSFSLTKEEQEILDSYSSIQNSIIVDYTEYEKKIVEIWGEFKNSSQKKQVIYSEDLHSRNIINYEKGEVNIGVIPVEGKTESQIKQDIQRNIDKIKNLTDLDGGQLFKEEIPEFEPEKIEKKEGYYNYVLKLRNTYQKKRVLNYLPTIKKYSKQYDVSSNLVLSIIKNESSFNPYARSDVAYGLMQLVPESGAMDAYEKVFGYRKVLTPSDLYKPSLNIRLGIGYLGKLKNEYFKHLKKYPDMQRICMIAAYNCGPTRINRITKNIDFSRMNSNKLTAFLNKKLPRETMIYLKRNLKDIKAMEKG